MAATLAPQTGRLDRHVRRSYLRIAEEASRPRVAFALEEALRLTSLPGEDEGRIYCFRRIDLTGISASANRGVWIERLQQVMLVLAAQAVHGSDPGAGAANAVFFNHLDEALEALLRKALHPHGVDARNAPEWFSASLLGIEAESSYALQIPAILQRLRPPCMAPGAAAALLFAALGDADSRALLHAIPAPTLREWLREMEPPSASTSLASTVHLTQPLKTTLLRAASHYGWRDPATLWLAAQAVLILSPSASASGQSLRQARTILRALEEQEAGAHFDRSSNRAQEASRTLVFDDEEAAGIAPGQSSAGSAEALPPQTESSRTGLNATEEEDFSSGNAPLAEKEISESLSIEPKLAAFRAPLQGEATRAAGLFFLLNPLRLLGIAAALEACPALAEANLAVHILMRLAEDAAVADDDPARLCLASAPTPFTLPAESLAELSLQENAWPRGFSGLRRRPCGSDFFLRVWAVAVRRWCWRNGRISLRAIVNRDGRIWQTRSDLDVTLPLAETDIRIRRIGLDIDPGWLPWFGAWGRVVRFHYRDREPEGTR
ncbi:MAG: hypothetical protein WCA21_07200 [Terracidiphilus sp.]|jgi:hypothetical protein